MCIKYVTNPATQYDKGFSLAYRFLMQSLVNHDYDSLQNILEGNLLEKFGKQIYYIKQNNLKLKLLNEQLNPKSKPLEMRIVDHNHYCGASVDRVENKRNGLRESSPFFMNLPNVKLFIPSNPLTMLKNFSKSKTDTSQPFKLDKLSMEITLAFTTNLKLDLID